MALPVGFPLHKMSTLSVASVKPVGSVMSTLSVVVHPLESVTVTMKVPAQRLVAMAFVCADGSFHRNV